MRRIANKPTIILSGIAAVSIVAGSFFYIKYDNKSNQYKCLQGVLEDVKREKESALSKVSEYEANNLKLLQQIVKLGKEKKEAEELHRKSQLESEELEKNLEEAASTVDLEKNKVSELEVKASGLQEQLDVANKTIENIKVEADKYKGEHKYSDSVVEGLKKELIGVKDLLSDYIKLKKVLEEKEKLWKENKEIYERRLEECQEGLISYGNMLYKWLGYVDVTYLGKVRDRIEDLIEDRAHLESIMENIFDPTNVKSGHNKELYNQVVWYITNEQARQMRLEIGPYKALVERERQTEDLIIREQEH